MKKIVLVCSAGASTSMMVKKMLESAKAENFDCTIEAHPVAEVASFADADVILLGPQVRFQLDTVRSKVSCPADAIDMRAYGMMDGAAVLAQARKLMGE